MLFVVIIVVLLVGCLKDQVVLFGDVVVFVLIVIVFKVSIDKMVVFGIVVDVFIQGMFEYNLVFVVNVGKYEYDGKLFDYSFEGFKVMVDWFYVQYDMFVVFIDDMFDIIGCFQCDYVLVVIDGQLFWLEQLGFFYFNLVFYIGDFFLSMYFICFYVLLVECMVVFVSYEEVLLKVLVQVKVNFKILLLVLYIDLGINLFGGFVVFFKNDVLGIFVSVKDKVLQVCFKVVNVVVIVVLQQLVDWLKVQKLQVM